MQSNSGFEKILKEKEALRTTKKQLFYKRLKMFMNIFITISITISIIFGIVHLIKKIPKNELMETKIFEIYNLDISDDPMYITYIDKDEDNKICKDCQSSSEALYKIHLSEDDNDYVTVEKWGNNGKVKKRKITQILLTEKTYDELSKKYKWENATN